MCETTTDGGDAYARTLATRSTVYACGCVCRLRLDDSNLDALESGVDWCTHISYRMYSTRPCGRARELCVLRTPSDCTTFCTGGVAEQIGHVNTAGCVVLG